MQLSSLLVLALTCMVLVIVSVGGWRSWVGQLNTSKAKAVRNHHSHVTCISSMLGVAFYYTKHFSV